MTDLAPHERQLDDVYRDRFEPVRFLSAGLFGRVFLVNDRQAGETVALKIPRTTSGPLITPLLLPEEQDNLRAVSGAPHLPVLLGAESEGPQWLATKFLSGGNVRQFVLHEDALTPEDAVLRALALFRAAHELLVAQRVHHDLHLGNLMFDAPPAAGGALTVIDLQRCYPARGFGFYYNFPLPSKRVSRRHPLRGMWYGLDERIVHLTAAQLVIALSCKLLPPHRRDLAMAHWTKQALELPRWRIARSFPPRLGQLVLARCLPEGVPFELSLRERAEELADAVDLNLPAWPEVTDPDPDAEAALPLASLIDAVTTRAPHSGVLDWPGMPSSSAALASALEAIEPQRGLWLQALARPSRRAHPGALVFDLLRSVFTQQNLTAKRAILGNVLSARLVGLPALWNFIPDVAARYGLEVTSAHEPSPQQTADQLKTLIAELAVLYGHVVLSVDDATAWHAYDAEVFSRLDVALRGTPCLLVCGR